MPHAAASAPRPPALAGEQAAVAPFGIFPFSGFLIKQETEDKSCWLSKVPLH